MIQGRLWVSPTSFQNDKFSAHPHGIDSNVSGMTQVANAFRILPVLPGLGVPVQNKSYTLMKGMIMPKLPCLNNAFNHFMKIVLCPQS